MIIVNIHEAKTKLSKLLSLVETKNEKVTICRNGKAIAELKALSKAKPVNPFRLHPTLSKVKILGDITAPVDEDDWPEEYR